MTNPTQLIHIGITAPAKIASHPMITRKRCNTPIMAKIIPVTVLKVFCDIPEDKLIH